MFPAFLCCFQTQSLVVNFRRLREGTVLYEKRRSLTDQTSETFDNKLPSPRARWQKINVSRRVHVPVLNTITAIAARVLWNQLVHRNRTLGSSRHRELE